MLLDHIQSVTRAVVADPFKALVAAQINAQGQRPVILAKQSTGFFRQFDHHQRLVALFSQ